MQLLSRHCHCLTCNINDNDGCFAVDGLRSKGESREVSVIIQGKMMAARVMEKAVEVVKCSPNEPYMPRKAFNQKQTVHGK